MDRYIKDSQVSCNNCNLDSICLPRGLNRDEVEDLSIVVKNNAVLQKGEYIYRQGDEFQSIVAIKSGTAKLVTLDDQGNEHILNVLLPGELIGFDGLYQNKYTCSAIALEIINYCELPAAQFDAVCKNIPSIARELFKHSSEIINESQGRMITNKRSAEEKLAIFLLNLSDRLKKRGFSAVEFNIPLSRQEMGDYLGLTIETVSRMLKQFQNDKLINIQKRHVEIIDIQGLRNLVSGEL